MLTIPVQSMGAAPATAASVLVIGGSEKVLRETVDRLRAAGHCAGASNEFDVVLDHFDATSLTVVVMGGMVPPPVKEDLRTRLMDANPDIVFVQGLAGIPGLIAAQVEAAIRPSLLAPGSIDYHPDSRTVRITLGGAQPVRVVAFWGTAFVPPDPESTSEEIFSRTLQAGTHTVALPSHVPAAASFVVVHAGPSTHAFTVGEMPPGTTLAVAAR